MCGCLKLRRRKEDLGKRVRGRKWERMLRDKGLSRNTDPGIKTVEDMWFGHKCGR